MAKKPAAPAADVPAMDYAQHNATYSGFLTLVKAGIVSMAFLVLALFCFIEAGQPVLGAVLLVLMIVVPVAQSMMGKRRPA